MRPENNHLEETKQIQIHILNGASCLDLKRMGFPQDRVQRLYMLTLRQRERDRITSEKEHLTALKD